MKIKNKKIFWSGIIYLSIALFLVIMMILTKDFDIKSMVISLVALLVGGFNLTSSFDDQMSNELINEMDDEREKFIDYKAKAITLTILDITVCAFVVILGLMYKINTFDRSILIPVVTALLFTCGVRWIGYIITHIIINKKN